MFCAFMLATPTNMNAVITPAAIKRRVLISFLIMIWLWFGSLCYKLTTIKNSQVGRYDSSKKYNFAAKVRLANSLGGDAYRKA